MLIRRMQFTPWTRAGYRALARWPVLPTVLHLPAMAVSLLVNVGMQLLAGINIARCAFQPPAGRVSTGLAGRLRNARSGQAFFCPGLFA